MAYIAAMKWNHRYRPATWSATNSFAERRSRLAHEPSLDFPAHVATCDHLSFTRLKLPEVMRLSNLLESDGCGGPGFDGSDWGIAGGDASASSFPNAAPSPIADAFFTSRGSPWSPSAASDHGAMKGSMDHSSRGTESRLGYDVASMNEAKSGRTPPPRGPSARRLSVPAAAPMDSPLRLQNAFAVFNTAVFTFLVLWPMDCVPFIGALFFEPAPPPTAARSSSRRYAAPVAPPKSGDDFCKDFVLASDAAFVNVVTKR